MSKNVSLINFGNMTDISAIYDVPDSFESLQSLDTNAYYFFQAPLTFTQQSLEELGGIYVKLLFYLIKRLNTVILNRLINELVRRDSGE